MVANITKMVNYGNYCRQTGLPHIFLLLISFTTDSEYKIMEGNPMIAVELKLVINQPQDGMRIQRFGDFLQDGVTQHINP